MAMSTMDNASAQLAIALQLHDLDALEALGTVDKAVIRIQRQQLEIDSGFDAVTFETSRRLALSMAKAVEDDSTLLAQSEHLPRIDKATFDRLALLNRLPPTSSDDIEPVPQLKCTERVLASTAGSLKRARSPTPEDEPSFALISQNVTELTGESHTAMDHTEHPHKKARPSTAGIISNQTMEETAPMIAIEPSPSTADCASCGDHINIVNLVKASCEHYYCGDCFGQFVEASLQTHDGFPPKCCKIPITFVTVSENVSAAVFSAYSARQTQIKNATAVYCGIQGCGLRIEEDRIKGVRATCPACRNVTCTLCRGEYPKSVNGNKVRHVCQKDKAREQVLALAKQEGWQTCFQCGNLVALNTGCHHMRCRCQAEFCYRCGIKWRNCDCGDYDEPRLDIRAARGVTIRAARRAAHNLPADPRPHEEQLAELRERLQVNCDHNNYFYEGGKTPLNPGYCQICEYQGWKYIYRCDSCGFTACNWCHSFHGWDRGDNPWANFDFRRARYDDDTDEETDDDTDDEVDDGPFGADASTHVQPNE